MELGTERPQYQDEASLSEYLRRLCSDVTLQSNKNGFFASYVTNIHSRMSPASMEAFSKLKDDVQRIAFLWDIKEIHELNIQRHNTTKNDQISENRRLEGNKVFQLKDYNKALKIYTQAVVRASPDGGSLSYAYANRSAALFHLKHYQLCLQDIQCSLNHNYPQKLRYKVFDRKGQCLEALGKIREAKISYQLAQKLLESAELSEEKLNSSQESLKNKINSLAQESKTSNETEEDQTRGVFGGFSSILPAATEFIEVKQTKEEGRFLVATSDLPAGAVVIQENPMGAVLSPEKNGRHCIHCFKYLIAPVPCLNCSNVVFCSVECREKSFKTYHKWECPFLDLLTASGISLNSYSALRILTENSLPYFEKFKNQKTKPDNVPTKEKPHISSDYSSFLDLASLSSLRDVQDFFHRALMAIFLLKILITSGYFGTNGNSDKKLTDDQKLVGGLLLRNLQIIQMNAHEISWVTHKKNTSFKECKSALIGLGVYPTASFLNHSCVPSIGRYFDGSLMTIVTLRPIRKGEKLEENYGPIFTKQTLEERQRKLSARYWFKCRCEACTNNWPLYPNIKSEDKCSFKCSKCDQEISSCSCKKKFNVNNMKTLKSKHLEILEDYGSAIESMNEGKRDEAIKLLEKCVTFWYSNICLPYKEYHLAIESLRLLMASKGADYTLNL